MKLSIITINKNNAPGLSKTIESIVNQSWMYFEYILIDGGSTDNSKNIILSHKNKIDKWVCEPDKGIYNAMNKGIKMASGDYIQFLNSGDTLVSQNVLEKVSNELGDADIVVGNMIKKGTHGLVRDTGLSGKEITFYDLYLGTINHSSAFIRNQLFNDYGFYEEEYRIVSDWEFYVRSVGLGNATVKYIDVDVTEFDMTGISNKSFDYFTNERRPALEKLVPPRILADYDRFYSDQQMLNLIKRNSLTKLFLKAIYKIAKLLNKSHA